jgi:hypothetical protein
MSMQKSSTTYSRQFAPSRLTHGSRPRHARYRFARESTPSAGALAILAAFGSIACDVTQESSSDADEFNFDVGVNQQTMGIPANYTVPWLGGIVPYCYQPSPRSVHPQPGTTVFNQTIEIVEDAIAKYEAVPQATIDFQGGALCTDWDDYVLGGDPDILKILLTTADAAFRSCDGLIPPNASFETICEGPDWSQEVMVAFGKDYGVAASRLLHELAHAMGFGHEYLRKPDGPTCDRTGPTSNGLTAFDEDSILFSTYCHDNLELSELDKVALAFTYPDATVDRLTIPRSFRLPDEVFVTAAESGAVIQFTQRIRGIEEYHFSAAQWLKSTPSGSTQIASGSSVSVGTVLGSSSEAILRGQFTDFSGRVRTTPFTSLRRDPSLFAALLLSATRVL